jgi:hypothetical protein
MHAMCREVAALAREPKMQGLGAVLGRRRTRWSRFLLVAGCSMVLVVLVRYQYQVPLQGQRVSPALSQLECFRSFERQVVMESTGTLRKWFSAFGGFVPPTDLNQCTYYFQGLEKPRFYWGKKRAGR